MPLPHTTDHPTALRGRSKRTETQVCHLETVFCGHLAYKFKKMSESQVLGINSKI